MKNFDDLKKAAVIALALILLPLTAAAAERGEVDWTGPYAGGSLGAGAASGHITDPDCFLCETASFDELIYQGGINAGYNKQFDAAVIGAEADIELGSQRHHAAFAQDRQPAQDSFSKITWSGALLARAGLAKRNALIFVDAGPAIARFSGSVTNGRNSPPYKYTAVVWQPGFKAGGGVEFMVTEKLALRAAYSVLTLADRTAYIDPRSAAGASALSARIIWANTQSTLNLGAEWRF